MLADREPPADPDKLRKFDRNLLKTGHRLAHRVVEPTPFCWFCGSTSGTRSKEHIFPQWLLRHYGAMDERVQPVRISMALGGALASERPARPLRSHVNGEVCAKCNNGWMSALEVSATPILTQLPRSGPISEEEALILARWFAKTAVNLNVSQPFRLLVDATSRHDLAISVPDRFAVHLFRVREQNGVIDWVQKSPDTATYSGGPVEEVRRLLELTLVAHIRIADLVAVVVHAPEPLCSTDITLDGAAQIYPPRGRLLTWEELPLDDNYLGPFAHADIVGKTI